MLLLFLGEQRTTNQVEGTNGALRKHNEGDHPTPWHFIEQLKGFQVKTDNLVRELKEKGANPAKKTRTSRDEQQDLCQRYEEFTPMEFLIEIAKTL